MKQRLTEQGLTWAMIKPVQVAGVVVKDRGTEAAMCADLARLGGVCLIAKR
jgi:hypothetical protein